MIGVLLCASVSISVRPSEEGDDHQNADPRVTRNNALIKTFAMISVPVIWVSGLELTKEEAETDWRRQRKHMTPGARGSSCMWSEAGQASRQGTGLGPAEPGCSCASLTFKPRCGSVEAKVPLERRCSYLRRAHFTEEGPTPRSTVKCRSSGCPLCGQRWHPPSTPQGPCASAWLAQCSAHLRLLDSDPDCLIHWTSSIDWMRFVPAKTYTGAQLSASVVLNGGSL